MSLRPDLQVVDTFDASECPQVEECLHATSTEYLTHPGLVAGVGSGSVIVEMLE